MSFAPFADKMRAEGLPSLAIDLFGYYYDRYRAGATGKLAESEIAPAADVPDVTALAKHRDAGAAALAKTVVVKLNGGLGTSMGMTRAKSLLPVKDGLSFLDVIVRQTLHLRRAHGVRLPLILMNSFRTREDSRQVLAKYPDLDVGLPDDFLQHKVPRILKSDLTPAAWPSEREHEWCPPGHGDLYPALETSGLLARLLDGGYRYAFVSNADNLGAVLDLAILGWFAAERIPFLMEVTDRTEADRKGGHLARRLRDGRLVLRESAQCADEDAAAFQDIHRHRFFNANNLWLDLEALANVLADTKGILGLPMIANEKPVDPADPKSAKVVQLETAMGAAIEVFPGAQALRVNRDRFVPVKTTSDLLVLWSDVYQLADDARIVQNPKRKTPSPFVDLDSRFYRTVQELESHFPAGAPSLVEASRFVVKGDVRFESGVVVVGDVTVTGPQVVAAGTRLVGQ